jgi:hypothetical protein
MSNGPEPQWTKRFTIQISPDLLEEVGLSLAMSKSAVVAN